jgi:hypothetical protein
VSLIHLPSTQTSPWAAVALRFERWARRNNRVVVVTVAVAGALLAWLRLPPVARDTLWAEDGRNFLQNAMQSGPIDSLFVPYAGYLHTVPRVIAAITVQFAPVADYAQWMTAGACLAAGAIAAIVYVTSVDIVRSVPVRLVLSGITVLAPLAPREVLGNVANLHSLVLWGLFWMLLYRPRSRHGAVALGIVALLGSLTEIQSVFLLPLLLWRPRDRRGWPLRLGFAIGALAQVAVTLVWSRNPNTTAPAGLASTLYGYLINAVMPIWLPQSAIGPALVAGGGAFALVLPFVAAAAVAVWHGSPRQRIAVIGLAAGSLTVYGVSIALNPAPFYDYASMSPSQLATVWLARYGVVPSMMLLAIPLVAVSTVTGRAGVGSALPRRIPPRIRARRTPRIRTRPGPRTTVGATSARLAVVGVVLVLVLAQFVPQYTRRSAGPAWQPQLASAEKYCEGKPGRAFATLKETISWHVDVACWRL